MSFFGMGSEKAQEARRDPSRPNLMGTLAPEPESLRRAYNIGYRGKGQYPQVQESLTAQLRALKVAANKLGFNDAAEWLERQDV